MEKVSQTRRQQIFNFQTATKAIKTTTKSTKANATTKSEPQAVKEEAQPVALQHEVSNGGQQKQEHQQKHCDSSIHKPQKQKQKEYQKATTTQTSTPKKTQLSNDCAKLGGFTESAYKMPAATTKRLSTATTARIEQRTSNNNNNGGNNNCHSTTLRATTSIRSNELHSQRTLHFDFEHHLERQQHELQNLLLPSQLTATPAAAKTKPSTPNWQSTAIFNSDFFTEIALSSYYRRLPSQCFNGCSAANIYKLFSYVSLGSCSGLSGCLNVTRSYGASNFDLRSFLYVALLVLIYCSVLIRATTASTTAATATETTPSHATSSSASTRITIEKNVVAAVNDTFPFSAANESTVVTNSTASAFAVFENLRLETAANETLHFNSTALHRLSRRDAANVPDDDDDSSYHDDEFDEYDALIKNKSAKGKYIGAPCNDMKCEPTLLHVICDKETLTCGCEKNYPVQLGLIKGCDKPKKLGEQCFYDETCMYNDENSLCVQVRHNALCQCANGFHSVSYTKPKRQVFCTQDLKELTSDLPTLLGVTTGIAVLAGLICMVLHLFSKTKYPRHRNFGDANIPPPIMYSSDTGIPLTVQSGRPSSRSSLRSSGSIGSYGNRRSSSGGLTGGGGGGGGGSGVGAGSIGAGGSKGILVSTSRTGSRRPSLASVHSTSSSVRSYSMMRFEKETQQKEIRQEMKLRLARLQQQQQMSQNKPQIIIGDTLSLLSGRGVLLDHAASGNGSNNTAAAVTVLSRLTMATPSPLTPNSTDELLPSVDELQEYPLKSEMLPMTTTMPKETINVAAATLTAVKEIASTSAAALAVRAKSEMSPRKSATITNESAAADVAKQLDKDQLAEAGAYIGPCSSSTEAL